MTRSEKIAYNKLQKRVSDLYGKNCCNIAIDVFDISKVFAFAKEQIKIGQTDEQIGPVLREFTLKLAA